MRKIPLLRRSLLLARLAKTSWKAERSRIKWWKERCAERGVPFAPVSVQTVELAGALLMEGNYKSSRAYLSVIKRLHIMHGARWTDGLALASSDCRKACERGMGPPEHADPLPLEALLEIDPEIIKKRARATWPEAGFDAAVVYCAWLLR